MAVTNADILGWLNANPGASDELIAQTMQEAGVSPEQMAQATGADVAEVAARYEAALAPEPAYFNANPDVANAYQDNSYGMTPQEFANFHYTNYGVNEGRAPSSASVAEPPPPPPPPVATSEPAGIASLPVAQVALPEPTTQVTNADILGWLNANPNADATLINQTMKEAGVSANQYQ